MRERREQKGTRPAGVEPAPSRLPIASSVRLGYGGRVRPIGYCFPVGRFLRQRTHDAPSPHSKIRRTQRPSTLFPRPPTPLTHPPRP